MVGADPSAPKTAVALVWDDGRIEATDQLEAEARRIVAVAGALDLATPVPDLGRWKARDVVAHLGGVHEWATRIITSRSMDGPGFRKSKLNGAALVAWYETVAAELVEVFRTNDPAGACPNFNPGSEKTVGWWLWRQLHETTVHRYDVEMAAGDTTPIDPAVAADGVDEVLDTFVRTRGKQTATGPIALATTNPARRWTITLAAKPQRVDVTRGEAGEVDGTLSGPAEDLLLVLWGRRSIEESALIVDGDEAAVGAFLAGA